MARGGVVPGQAAPQPSSKRRRSHNGCALAATQLVASLADARPMQPSCGPAYPDPTQLTLLPLRKSGTGALRSGARKTSVRGPSRTLVDHVPTRAFEQGVAVSAEALEQHKRNEQCARAMAVRGKAAASTVLDADRRRVDKRAADTAAAALCMTLQADETLDETSRSLDATLRPASRRKPVRRVPPTPAPMAPLIWHDTCDAESNAQPSFQQRAFCTPHTEAAPVSYDLCLEASMSQMLVLCGGGRAHAADHSTCIGGEALSPEFWTSLAEGIVSVRVRDDSNGGAIPEQECSDWTARLAPLANGHSNVVYAIANRRDAASIFVAAEAAAGYPLHTDQVVMRITRPDDAYTRTHPEDSKFQTLESAAAEMQCTLHASINGFGTRVFTAFSYVGACRNTDPQYEYGTVFTMQRARRDLFDVLSCPTTSNRRAAEVAVQMMELLVRVSWHGSLCLDIKPANILEFGADANECSYRLADFDPCFYFMHTGKDWHSTLLLNLVLLAAHVRNMKHSACAGSFLSVLVPNLRQLMHRRDSYDCAWLFETRSVCTEHCDVRGDYDFVLQKTLCVMCTQYFYGTKVVSDRKLPCASWNWETRDRAQLKSHWRSRRYATTWPPDWPAVYTPLVTQLYNFAISSL